MFVGAQFKHIWIQYIGAVTYIPEKWLCGISGSQGFNISIKALRLAHCIPNYDNT